MTYRLIKKIIAKGNYDKDDLMNKLDVFLLAGRITDDEYKELVDLINNNAEDKSNTTTEAAE